MADLDTSIRVKHTVVLVEDVADDDGLPRKVLGEEDVRQPHVIDKNIIPVAATLSLYPGVAVVHEPSHHCCRDAMGDSCVGELSAQGMGQ